MYDIYLAGSSNKEWRTYFCDNISDDIKIFNPFVENFDQLSVDQKEDQAATEFTIEEKCCVLVFYFDEKWNGYTSLLELGNSIGCGKQVFVCFHKDIESREQITKFCEFHGAYVTDNLDDLISTVEQYMHELTTIVGA